MTKVENRVLYTLALPKKLDIFSSNKKIELPHFYF